MKSKDYSVIHRYGFYLHAAIYVLVGMVLWFVYGFIANQWQLLRYPIIGIVVGVALFLSLPWPLMIMAVWGLVLTAHGIENVIHWKVVNSRNLERERLGYQKSKRS